MQLPEEFVSQTRRLMGEERFARYLAAFGEEPPVSIRLNPNSQLSTLRSTRRGAFLRKNTQLSPVPWCRNAYYLPTRPNFTFDPLLHAGCYYVQEAASMFLDAVLRQKIVNRKSPNSKFLDLCAAPGGKSTLLRSAMPEGSILYSNEPVPKRASILLENITKWGHPGCIVTSNYPKDYRASKLCFDVILCDVPCSGEGMFRKDPQTISEWSPQNVEKCWRLQREIVADAWQCLNPGGLLIYSTCTFNIKENEENIRWILDNFDAEALAVDTEPEWGITGSLLPGFNAPVYRFIPGITRSEGLFMAVIRKGGESTENGKAIKPKNLNILTPPYVRQSPVAAVELSYSQSIAYLRGEALVLPPSAPRGIVDVSFMGYMLGQAKNIGNRANNLYPKEWRIKSTHVPSEYEPILKPLQ